ncbi:MAG TPA: hypothetical protein VHP11_17710 [Tepidisphaeraceae bacterium]|nr:hypothetical protein [Tepidisphaeraceae bacterium]
MDGTESYLPRPPVLSRKQRFFAGYIWFVLRNLIGWTLILLSLVAGPLVPGPGGIPLFLIGFALVTFPGKRKLTARVLRGRVIQLQRRALLLTIAGVSLVVSALALWLFGTRLDWLERLHEKGLLARGVSYLLTVVVFGVASGGAILLVNLLLRAMPRIRRHVRPWLRKHRIRLLPPRRRRRHPHEHGTGPLRLKDEILSFLKRPHPPMHKAD